MTITITEVRNGSYKYGGLIECEINHPEYGWIPYLINDADTDTTIDNNALKVLLGSNIAPFDQEEHDSQTAALVRVQRDGLLESEVDPIVTNPLRWGSLSDEQQLAFTVYRQNLLDITEQEGFPHNVVWPTKPEV